MMDIQKIVRDLGKGINRHSPTILTVLAGAGIIVTAYLSAKAGYKSAVEITTTELIEKRDLEPKEKLALVWKNYIPPLSIGMATLACVISSNVISVKRQTALVGAYAVSERVISAYKEKMIEQLGSEKAEEAQAEIVKETAEATSTNGEFTDIPEHQSLFLDSLSGQYFVSDIHTVRKAMNDVNQKCIQEGYASMNYFYSLIGARRTQIGEVIGWNVDRMLDLVITENLATEDGKICTGLDYRRQPTMEYHRVW